MNKSIVILLTAGAAFALSFTHSTFAEGKHEHSHGVKALGDGVTAATLDPKPTNLKAMSGRHTDGDFTWKIANGRGAMPSWNKTLNENQIWDLVNFIQNLKNINEHAHQTHEHEHKKKHTH